MRWSLVMRGATIAALLFLGVHVVRAASESIEITDVVVDFTAGEIIIGGNDFDLGGSPSVTLGGFAVAVLANSANQIVTELPAGLQDGDYLLTVSTGNGAGKAATYDLTAGAVGPEGPQGCTSFVFPRHPAPTAG